MTRFLSLHAAKIQTSHLFVPLLANDDVLPPGVLPFGHGLVALFLVILLLLKYPGGEALLLLHACPLAPPGESHRALYRRDLFIELREKEIETKVDNENPFVFLEIYTDSRTSSLLFLVTCPLAPTE